MKPNNAGRPATQIYGECRECGQIYAVDEDDRIDLDRPLDDYPEREY